ncbi:MAG: HD domain-containing protein [Syntrophobacteraceae bacterium]
MRLLDQFEMPLHIRKHSFLVAEVALFLGGQLKQNSTKLDLELIEAAALLHDVGKQPSFRTREDHALLGARMLEGIVDPAIAEIVKEHIFLDSSLVDGPITESLIVNYSDKRVKHDQIVSVEERYHDLIARYAKSAAHRQLLLEKLDLYLKLEQRIFSHLTIAPLGIEIMGITIDHTIETGSEYHAEEEDNCCVAGGGKIC